MRLATSLCKHIYICMQLATCVHTNVDKFKQLATISRTQLIFRENDQHAHAILPTQFGTSVRKHINMFMQLAASVHN